MWAQLKRQVWQWRGVLITAPSVAALVIALRFTGLLQLLELAALDQLFLLRPAEPADSRLAIIEINESDVRELGARGQWPIPDAVLARVLENVKKQQPQAIGLDLYRDLPIQPGHPDLVKVFETTPNLIGVQKVGENTDSSPVPPPPILKQHNQVGVNDFPLDGDGKVRRGLLYATTKDNETIPSFALQLALIYLKPHGIVDKPAATNANYLQLGPAVFPTFEANDGGYVRAQAEGYQVLLNFRGSIEKFQALSILDVLDNKMPPNLLRGRIVLIGSTAESLKDIFYTPYTSSLFRPSRRMTGVAIHANLISQILSAALGDRPLIKTWPNLLEWLWILNWAGVGATLSWMQRYSSGMSKRAPWTAVWILLTGGCLLVISYWAFVAGWWIPLVPPLLALVGSSIAITAYIARTAGEIRKTFGRYLTTEVVANLLENPEGLKLGGERRKITILTSDIRGFTAVSERLPAEEVIKIINLYLGYMADVITHHQGTIDEFMGDGILVLFGAPTVREDDAERAIACAVGMQLAMTSVNEKMGQLGLPHLEMGIGINTGEVVVGNIGSEKRTKYGIVGDQVNLTYRIESYTVGGQIFASESTVKETGSALRIDGSREVQPKGVHQPIKIYEIGGIGGEYNLYLPLEQEEFFDLSQSVLLEYAFLDGKHIDSTLWKGRLVKLSAKGAEVRCDTYDTSREPLLPAPLTNLRLNLFMPNHAGEASDDVYAKVLETPASEHSFYIRFTNKPPEVEAELNTLYKSIVIKS
jgi:adenylate cyclase